MGSNFVKRCLSTSSIRQKEKIRMIKDKHFPPFDFLKKRNTISNGNVGLNYRDLMH
jgi:hypothetical protein